MHVPKYFYVSDGDDCAVNYCEEDDAYYLAEGWYERLVNWPDYAHIQIEPGLEIEWMPLPTPPESE